jgi:hypothetical protein
MSDRTSILESMLDLLLREEEGLSRLIAFALEEQAALVSSDFEAIDRVSAAMQAEAEAMERLEHGRGAMLEALGQPEATLEALLPEAIAAGFPAFTDARLRMAASAAELQEAQERNARLLLGAVKLQERWMNMLGGLTSSTYGAAGKQQLRPGRGIVSRSA